jgi:hypothetical protein
LERERKEKVRLNEGKALWVFKRKVSRMNEWSNSSKTKRLTTLTLIAFSFEIQILHGDTFNRVFF